MTDAVLNAIPHRPPFLFVDKIISASETQINTERKIREDEEFFKGHYPGNPLMPGVLICESIFQSAAILVGQNMPEGTEGVPVLTRIKEAKFKNMVFPGDVLSVQVDIVEKLGSTHFMKGVAKANGKVAVRVAFAVTLAPAQVKE